MISVQLSKYGFTSANCSGHEGFCESAGRLILSLASFSSYSPLVIFSINPNAASLFLHTEVIAKLCPPIIIASVPLIPLLTSGYPKNPHSKSGPVIFLTSFTTYVPTAYIATLPVANSVFCPVGNTFEATSSEK